jgi:pantetheine-phosphate adenylyltransferase
VSLTGEKQKMRIIALGGTFEILHKGHRKLLMKALQLGDRIIIGLTSDEFTSRKQKKHAISNYDERRDTIDDENIDGIVTSHETMKTALGINKIRAKKEFKPLRIYVIGFMLAKDGLPISVSRILSGTIDKEGKIL